MFNHKNFALNGLFPGLVSHRSIANLGHFEVEIIVQPLPADQVKVGGSGWLSPIQDHVIIVRIKKDDKVWEAQYVTSKYFADKVININAWVISFRKLLETVSVRIKQIGINIKQVIVKGRKL